MPAVLARRLRFGLPLPGRLTGALAPLTGDWQARRWRFFDLDFGNDIEQIAAIMAVITSEAPKQRTRVGRRLPTRSPSSVEVQSRQTSAASCAVCC